MKTLALVEGVVHAMNSEHAELVTAEEFSHAPGGWNGQPETNDEVDVPPLHPRCRCTVGLTLLRRRSS